MDHLTDHRKPDHRNTDHRNEDLDFKPLTQGLGFHNKVKKTPDSEQASPAPQRSSYSGHTINSSSSGSRPANSRSTSSMMKDFLEDDGSGDFADPLLTPARPILTDDKYQSRPQAPSSLQNSTDTFTEPDLHSDSGESPMKSLSELMASLPPSLDFIEDDEPHKLSKPTQNQIQSPKQNAADTSGPKLFKSLPRSRVEDMVDSQAVSRAKTSQPRQLLTPVPSQPSQPSTQRPAEPAWSKSSPASPNPSSQAPSSRAGKAVTAGRPKSQLEESLAKAFPKSESTVRTRMATPIVEAPLERSQLIAVPTAWAASALDMMVVIGFTLFALVALIMILNIDLINLIFNPVTSVTAIFQLGVLVAGIVQIYIVTSRCLFSQTLGEWAFEMQLGTDDQQRRISYPLLVLWRSLVMTVTAFVLIPILSTIARRDVGAYLSGLQLFVKRAVR